ncbi:MAG: hypothetical protein C4547_08195 [Phycisphaerales bacterium]|nr:MAG: hypothetical protein C4547_08195 [Phycisphaerales bacterium]
MSAPEPNQDPIERLMIAARDAEKAGVFEPTRAPIGAKPSGRAAGVIRLGAGLLSAAACLMLAVSVAQYTRRQANPGESPTMNVASAMPVSLDWGAFSGCLAGPGQPVARGCSHADLDADGDVDLADFRQFQSSVPGRE